MNVTLEIEALAQKLTADLAESRAVILRYTDEDKITSIGEHPNILEVLSNAFEKWDKAKSILESIQKFASAEEAREKRLAQEEAKRIAESEERLKKLQEDLEKAKSNSTSGKNKSQAKTKAISEKADQ